ncbi:MULTISPECIES: flagellar hook-length control protein FliK [Pseudomonas]|uniref:flagellar hook-length control protein FliK n=1 Tax=Pseudomonas TaxID=286 RepID=UPI001E2CBBCA|nr:MULTISPECIES: flagellar hook-length control protein FliK [Pseudomonas]MCE1115829.1 flagellar hook-length control protein FliK [Pseudomonas sp. NMI795_08]
MPVAPNPLLQSGPASSASRPAAGVASKPAQAAQGNGPGFDQVMSRQGRDSVANRDDKASQGPAQAAGSSKAQAQAGGKKDAAASKDLADDGNNLPASPADGSTTADAADATIIDASLVAGQVTDAQTGAQLIQAQAEVVAPVLQAALQPAQQPAPPAADAKASPAVTEFDPDADPLADMPALRLALEQSAKAQGATSAHASSARVDNSQQAAEPDAVAVNTLANVVAQVEAEPGHAEHGDKAFAGLLDSGLKDLKGASSDTRVDDFADRLASLTQAVTAKTANAVPVTPSPLQQPLAMNQGAWTEGLVNRVMYLSSQNLKSADIQLEPAELGRLDIRVNVAADQPTQIHFVSGHAGVRDALDSQVHRLRELFAQQGLAQPDVSVADQSRGQQQQQAQQDASNLSGVAARRAAAAGEGGELAEAGKPVEHQVVVGDSAVDYYA